MIEISPQPTDQEFEGISFNVAGYQNGRYIGPSEISRPSDPMVGAALEDATPPSLDPAAAHTRLEALVAACGSANDPSSFGKHKNQLLSDLLPPYALFDFVKQHPELLTSLREHEALKDRARRISEAKIALLCVYCKMRPTTREERSSCSDWTIWLEQAEHEVIKPDNFVTWGMGKSFKDCRDAVRGRRSDSKTLGGESTGSVGRSPQFNLRETKEGASVTLRGRQFSISKAVLKKVIAIIERAAPEDLLKSDSNNDEVDDHE